MIDWYLLPLAAIVDSLYVAWMWSAEKERPLVGGFTSVGIWGLTLLGVIEVADKPWNMVPILIGAFAGSYATILLKRKRNG
jgi:hypothetical protein